MQPPSSDYFVGLNDYLHESYSSADLLYDTVPMTEQIGTHSANDIQSHLYRAFLEGATHDVALHVRGSWEAIYRLHRVVLIQAGFFRSLFAGGFLESSSQLLAGRSEYQAQEVDIIFDDPNITRAAFEICIARLYGGGPPLHMDPDLIPTTREPLSSSFTGIKQFSSVPPGHHAASPRFLLSLLATAVYLSIPSIISQSVIMILKSVCPQTVVRYLNFAVGLGIGDNSYNDPEAATTLENIALPPQFNSSVLTRNSSARTFRNGHAEQDLLTKLNDLTVIQKEGSPNMENSEIYSINSIRSSVVTSNDFSPSYYYGPVSDKVGEAAVCWLTRWGPDMLAYEECSDAQDKSSDPTPSNDFTVKSSIPLIWRRGGLDSTWAKNIISSDSFFVRNEQERYDIACRVVELRRRQGIQEEEEHEWDMLFSRGIYYIHMSLDDLMQISQDISPTTGRSFVSLSVLQSAHWGQSLLRQHIMSRPPATLPNSPPRSPAPRDKELGLSITTEEILSSLQVASQSSRSEGQIYYPVAMDSSFRIGDGSALEGASMEQLFEAPNKTQDGKRIIPPPASQANLFGASNSTYSATECVAADEMRQFRWSSFPPLRFSVEFWGVEALKEKARLHSQTVWYAGSLFNVYVQVVRKKNLQLGVYLHRQSSVDPLPTPSSPPGNTGLENDVLGRTRSASLSAAASQSHVSPPTSSVTRPTTAQITTSIPRCRSTTPILSSPASSHFSPHTIPHAPNTSHQPYRDPRQSILAYFSILCASATGSSLTKFSSAPDMFAINQSWGWKSSRTEEYVDQIAGQECVALAAREISLRATVLLGIV